MAKPLTSLESSVYQYLIDFTAENTYQPSIRDIGARFKIKSTKTVSDLLQSLTRKGYIERDPARSRGVRLLGFAGGFNTQPVPYYGRVHAGEPALSPEYRESYITLDRRFVPAPNAFFLRVKGDSMVGKCIADGDYVLVNPDTRAQEGDIVAARLGEDATIKTYALRDGHVVLRPASDGEQEITVNGEDDFAVLGVVSGVFRPMAEQPRMNPQQMHS
ncbi:transcriptional repressor LexA [soil metagenome]